MNANTKAKAKAITIHVNASLARLRSGDVTAIRGAGTGTRATRNDWLEARAHGLAHGRAAVYGVPYDPIADGEDPGALMVFRRTAAGWHLVTCFPVDDQRPDTKRLENLT